MDENIINDYVKTDEIVTNPNVMPQNLEAEQSLLGSILYDNKILEDLPTSFNANYFFDPLHSNIFDACISLIDSGKLADPLTLKSYLKDNKYNLDIDIEQYLIDLRDGVLSLSKAKFYADEIRNCYIRRSLIIIADELIHKANHPSIEITPDQEISNTEEKLYNLAEKDQINSGPFDFKTVLASTTKQINSAFNRKGKLSGVDTGFSGINRHLGGLNKSDLIV